MNAWPTILFLILLVACVPPAETPQNDTEAIADNESAEPKQTDDSQAEEPKEQPEPTPEPEPAEKPKPSTPEETPEDEHNDTAEQTETVTSPPQPRTKLYDFLETFTERVDSYQFTYKNDEYFVRGNRYKIRLDRPVTVSHVTFDDIEKSLYYYDTIYVDRSTKNTLAYCEGHDDDVNRQCAELELYDLAYPVPYSTYDITLPEDWLLTYLDDEPATIDHNKYYVKGRAAVTATFDLQPQLQLHFDKGSGLVLRADFKQGNQLLERHDYENLATNKVRDVDVHHRSKDEIPSEETFYRP